MHSRVITVVRHVGRRVKIRATFAPATIVSPLSLIPPSSRKKKKKKGTDRSRGRVCIIHTWVQDTRRVEYYFSRLPARAPPFIPSPPRSTLHCLTYPLPLSLHTHLVLDRKIPSRSALLPPKPASGEGSFVNRYPISEEIRVVVKGVRLSFLSFVIVRPHDSLHYSGRLRLLISPIPRNIHTR